MKQIKTVLVDCDGVLYDKGTLTYEEMVTGCQQAGKDLGIDWSEVVAVHEALKDQGWRGWYNTTLYLCRQNNVSFTEIAKKMVQYVDYSRIQPDVELLNLLQCVSEKKDLFILTNNTRPHIEKVFYQLFHQDIAHTKLNVLTIEDTLWGDYFYVKAHPIAFEKWCQKLNTQPQETLMLDDTENVIEAARNQGLQTILIQNPEMTKKTLKGLI